ncbi:YkgJ family cysteine cluster protein [Candidatus Woesearchaeota archaeon]|nr:YkgJ family cysteine cluster protein [Candidatus Woesearchaeota archaeon]
MVGIDVCTQCADGQLNCINCCTSPFTEKDPGFWLTLTDIARIVKKTKINPDKFCRLTTVDDDDDDSCVDEKHGDLMYLHDKVILMSGKDKKCFFLGKKGCKIFDVRPKMCRIFPFYFDEEEGMIKITIEEESKEEDDCYLTKINHKDNGISHLLKQINQTEETMKECIKEYIEEMKLHDKYKNQLEKKTIMEVLEDNGFLEEV